MPRPLHEHWKKTSLAEHMESKERVGAVEYQSPSVWHEVHKQDNAPNIWDKLKDEERITFASQNWDTLPKMTLNDMIQ